MLPMQQCFHKQESSDNASVNTLLSTIQMQKSFHNHKSPHKGPANTYRSESVSMFPI